ncbi:hypothetical protein PsorP6_006280 [Peronosclerospora sorghi]|uniref:Uncharacterized protein n=1 Tax=Peronosclerospora sorghi TaxID=230839 RepID=A0ACC0W6J8_9STRA|nr:hypothetical protein PsorP6_006280 [Peronosclerospora sorghi]
MPRLKRLLGVNELNDAVEKATAEKLLTFSISLDEMRAQRQQVAALCSASFVTMSILTMQQNSTRADTHTIDKCVDKILQVISRKKHVLFLARDPKLVTKRLAVAVMSPDAPMGPEFAVECLRRVHFRNCRSVYSLLCELNRIETDWREMREKLGIHFVALGPLSDFFSTFQTASGISATGAGLKRMVELAIKRLRGTTNIDFSVIESPLTDLNGKVYNQGLLTTLISEGFHSM